VHARMEEQPVRGTPRALARDGRKPAGPWMGMCRAIASLSGLRRLTVSAARKAA